MLQIRTYVAASSIEGVGVFAAEPVSKGTVIWRSDPVFDLLFSDADYRNAPAPVRELLDRYAYPSFDNPGSRVYEIDNARFMNHAPSPNSDFSEYGYGTALRDIAAGEEITCDYGQFYGEAITAFGA